MSKNLFNLRLFARECDFSTGMCGGIPVQGLVVAVMRGFPSCYFDPFEKVIPWLLADSERKAAIARCLDGQTWEAPWAPGAKSKTARDSCASWPIGLAEYEPYTDIALTEGSPDFLAALALGQNLAPICMAGASISLPLSQIPKFSGKWVTIYQHNDEAGLPGRGTLGKAIERSRSDYTAPLRRRPQ
jgi:hypothetical protein